MNGETEIFEDARRVINRPWVTVMKRKDFLKRISACGFGLTMSTLFSPDHSKAAKIKRPNIIFLLSDDQRFDSMGIMGNKDIPTPNFDKLATDGIIFDNHYNTTSICMTSRAIIMTGMYEYKTGCAFARGSLTRELFYNSYPMLLKKAGYYTGFAGKFGYAVTDGPGKSTYHSNENLPIKDFDWWKGWPGQGSYKTAENEFVKEYAKEYPHSSAALGAASKDFIKEALKKKKPFCLSVSFKAPHGPTTPDPQFDEVFDGKTFSKPPNYGEKGSAHLPIQAKSGRQYLSKWSSYTSEKYDKTMKDYYQCIYGIDQAVGEIRKELKRLKIDKETIIIYTTDNGYFCGSDQMGGKVLLYEEGARGPLLIYDPSSPSAGKKWRSPSLTGNIDFAPTILEMAGLPIPENMDGKSLVPALKNPKSKIRDSLTLTQVWGANPAQAMAIVTDEWKYMYWFCAEGMEAAEELYDMKKDRLEMNNLARNPEFQSPLKKMRKLYDKMVKHWQEHAVDRNDYKEYATAIDRNVSWDEKKQYVRLKNKVESKEKGKEKGASDIPPEVVELRKERKKYPEDSPEWKELNKKIRSILKQHKKGKK